MIGSTVHCYDSVGSTNDIARNLAKTGAADGTVVVANVQTNGRGSRGRTWTSPAGVNLMLSVILKPEISTDRNGELAFVAAVAVAGTLRDHFGLDARIKWPNDVLVNGRKIAGMIVESAKGAAVLGLGLNVNWTDLPNEIASTATSIAIEKGSKTDLDAILKVLLADLDIAYGVYRARGFSRTLADWRLLEVTIGKDVRVVVEDNVIQGLAVDVDERGNLIVELPSGERIDISAATLVQ